MCFVCVLNCADIYHLGQFSLLFKTTVIEDLYWCSCVCHDDYSVVFVFVVVCMFLCFVVDLRRGQGFDSLGVLEMKCVMIILFPASTLFVMSEQNGSFVSRNGNFMLRACLCFYNTS